MSRLYNRSYQLNVGKLEIIGNERNKEGLNISFNIKKKPDAKKSGNSATINITNLSDDNINYIRDTEPAIILRIGYDNVNKVIFKGIVKELDTDDYTGGMDRRTTLKCVPSNSVTYTPVVSMTLLPNQSVRNAVDKTIESSGLTVGTISASGLNNRYPHGYSIEGSPRDVLSQLGSENEFEYRIDNDTVHVTDIHGVQGTTGNATVISPLTGLIGVPTRASPDGSKVKSDKDRKNGIRFKALANPDLQPGRLIKIENTKITGLFRIKSVTFNGDWRGGNWTAVCYCQIL